MYRVQMFTEDEQKTIDKTIATLREQRSYSTKPTMLHDLVLIGCQIVLSQTHLKPFQKA